MRVAGEPLDLPLGMNLSYNGFWRDYDNLLTWSWSEFPLPSAAGYLDVVLDYYRTSVAKSEARS